eukprot:1338694-Heterocapsa_arctica.AAC.1
MPAVYLKWPRGAMHFWWSMHKVYAALQLKSFKQLPSKWAYESAASWKKLFKELAPKHSHYLPSRLADA